ncbi:RHS repeat protein [Selenomonas ruminantium]|nr:RHS repeat protein [Selenomonas ruminantium]
MPGKFLATVWCYGICDGNKTSYVLDNWGRITEIRKADGAKENYAYDFAGNITEAVDGNGNKRIYVYDDNNHLKSITYPDGSQEQYLYGVDGNLSKFQDRNDITNEYTWNVYGSLIERKAGDLRNVYEYSPNGQLIAAISNGMDYRYTYDKDGAVKKITHANGMWQDNAYDADKNITSLTVATPDKILAQNSYRYGGNGQRSEKNELTGQRSTPTPSSTACSRRNIQPIRNDSPTITPATA